MRCYDDDAGQLVDVCRQCICFATVQDMATCLHRIRQHPALEVPPSSSVIPDPSLPVSFDLVLSPHAFYFQPL